MHGFQRFFEATLIVAATLIPAPARAGEVRSMTLENGLRVYVKESFAKDLVALSLHVDGGNRTESRELSGLSHYYEHLIFRGGTKKQAELETRKVFLGLGEFGGYTTTDYTAYNFLVPSATFDEALWRFADTVMNVDVTAEKVAKEREVVMSEFKMSYADSPSGWAWYNLARSAFRVHPYGRTTIGLREVIEGADLERFRTFYAERYVPNHTVIAVVGAIRADEAFAKVRAAFGGFKPGRPSFETGESEPEQKETRVVVEARTTEKSYAAIGWKAPGAAAPDAYAVRVLAQVLGGGAASRLEREVRAKRGLALEAGAGFDDTKDPGLFEVGLTLDPGREVDAVAAVADEAAKLARDLVPEDELERAKNALANGWIFGRESFISQAQWITRFAIWGDPNLGEDCVERVRAVRAEEVRDAARRIFASTRATVSIVHPKGPAPASDALAAALKLTDEKGDRPSFPKTEMRRLTSGVRAIVREDRSAPIVAATLELPSPLAAEPAEKPGLAALGERLMLRGAGNLSRDELSAMIDSLGVRIDTGLDYDALSVTLDAPVEKFETGLDLMAAVALAPRFEPDEVEKARTETIAAIQGIDDRSFDLAAREFYAALYDPKSTYGRPIAGTVEGVRAATREDLVAWFHQVASLGRGPVVAVVGAIEPERAFALLEKAFAPRGEPRLSPLDRPVATPIAAPRDRLLQRPREQVCFRLGHVGLAAGDPDFIPLAVGIRHLASQLFFRYVYEKGMAYRCWVYLGGGLGPQPFTFEMGVSAPNFKAARAGLEESLRSLVAAGLTAEEVEKAKTEAIQRHLLRQQTDLSQAGMLATYEAIGLGWKRCDDLPDLYRKVTRDEVNAALKKHLHPDRLTIAVVGDLGAAGVIEVEKKP